MKRLIILIVALAVTWLVWSGLYKPLLLGLGVLSLTLAVWLALRMQLTERKVFAIDTVPNALGYWIWLAGQVLKSNIDVAKIVLSPSLPISPSMVTIRAPLPGLIGQATLANSITLTPGTVTVDAHQGVFVVHSLTRDGAREVEEGEMARRVAEAFGDR